LIVTLRYATHIAFFHLLRVRAMTDNRDNIYLSARQIQERYGNCSRMWTYRRMADSGFPKPERLGGRLRFWKLADIEHWERERAKA
jgi:predicted DNA-binding transcriptional regulator AlpA